MIVNHKVKTYFGFAIKSANIVLGGDNVCQSGKNLYLVVITQDINRTSQKRISEKCINHGIPMITATTEQLDEVLNKNNCKCVAVTEKHLADAILCEQKGGSDE